MARAYTATSYYFTDGFEVVERVLREGIAAICATAGIEPPEIDAAFFGIPGYGESSADIPRLDAVPRADPRPRPLQLRQRHGVRLGRLAGAARRHQRHQRHRIDDLRRTRRARPSRRRLGRAVRRRGIRVLDRCAGPQRVQPDERRPRCPRGPLYDRDAASTSQLTSDLDAVEPRASTGGAASRAEIAALCRARSCAGGRREMMPCRRGILADAGRRARGCSWRPPGCRLGFADDEPVPVSYSGGMFSDEQLLERFPGRD